ncbi:MAG: hypothetical protein Q8M29_07340 [Bacteroidota bacterium]|nr:hypothetical protein [Bacteroidota bacterium]
MLSRKEFERQYSAELLPSSMANYAIGDLWDWKGGLFNWHLVPEMNNVALVCNDQGLYDKLKSVPMLAANLPDIDITKEFKSDTGLNIPTLNLSLSNVLAAEKVESFKYKSVQGKNAMEFRGALSDILNSLKTADFEKYKKYVREKEVVLAFYYADSVEIDISRTISNKAELEAKIGSIPGVTITEDLSATQTYKYKISGPACPFAAQFMDGRDI